MAEHHATVLQRLHEAGVPIVICSANRELPETFKGMPLIEKPYTKESLIATIERELERLDA